MNVQETVVAYFESLKGLPGNTLEDKLKCAYLDARVIDSMGIIEMIAYFEDAFQIQFSADDLQLTEFQVVSGLINIIERLREGV